MAMKAIRSPMFTAVTERCRRGEAGSAPPGLRVGRLFGGAFFRRISTALLRWFSVAFGFAVLIADFAAARFFTTFFFAADFSTGAFLARFSRRRARWRFLGAAFLTVAFAVAPFFASVFGRRFVWPPFWRAFSWQAFSSAATTSRRLFVQPPFSRAPAASGGRGAARAERLAAGSCAAPPAFAPGSRQR